MSFQLRKLFQKLFRGVKIDSEEDFFVYHTRKKIVVFVPDSHLEKVATGLSNAGAGRIGNYSNCSFRTSGTGTFKPESNASPYSGKRNEMSFEEEVRLEMEFDPALIDDVVSALFKSHPYEEVAYEIYEFQKRKKKASGRIFKIGKPVSAETLLAENVFNKIEIKADMKKYIRTVAVTGEKIDDELISSARNKSCELLINILPKKNLYKIL